MVGEGDETLSCATIITLSVFFNHIGFANAMSYVMSPDACVACRMFLAPGGNCQRCRTRLGSQSGRRKAHIPFIEYIFFSEIHSTRGNGINFHAFECVLYLGS